ncbi:MAG: ribosome silencing factor [Limnothrix sp. RL_2_0]|nr:ribosome silencing factor [Limnothrix sp. RL_2_0]
MNLPKNLEALESGRLAWSIAEAADDRKAEDIVLLQVNEVSYLADFFVVATGFSRTQVRAIADSIEQKLEDEYDRVPLRMEGRSDGTWILQDYGEVIVHVFLPQEREFYNLEAFWGHAESIEYQPALS